MSCEQPPLAKVLIVGSSNVGKTSLVNSLIFQDFFDVSPTIGINFAQTICYGDKGPMNISIWDLSGQDRFRFLMPQLCGGAAGVVLVFDQTDPLSLDKLADWLKLILSCANPFSDAIVLVGTKADLIPTVPPSEIRTFCNTHNISEYIPCSAKSGKNIKLIFEKLCSAIQRNSSKVPIDTHLVHSIQP